MEFDLTRISFPFKKNRHRMIHIRFSLFNVQPVAEQMPYIKFVTVFSPMQNPPKCIINYLSRHDWLYFLAFCILSHTVTITICLFVSILFLFSFCIHFILRQNSGPLRLSSPNVAFIFLTERNNLFASDLSFESSFRVCVICTRCMHISKRR